jgi:ABC-type nitrate/sulfonate/bicarbonate transport system substrate-binding protein
MRRRIVTALALSLLGLTLAACGGGTAGSTGGDAPPPTVRVAYVPNFTSTGAVAIGNQMGMFAPEGIQVAMQSFPGGQAVVQSLLTNDADVAVAPYTYLFSLRQQGQQIVALSNLASNRSQVLLARNGSGVTGDPQTLLGKTFGANGAFGDSVYRSVYAQLGQDPAQAKVVQFQSFDALIAAMSQGQIDLAVTNGPSVQNLITKGGAAAAFRCTDPQVTLDFCAIPNTGLLTTQKWLDAHGTEASALVKGLGATVDKAHSDPEAVLTAAATLAQAQDPAAFKEQNRAGVASWSVPLDQTAFQAAVKAAFLAGQSATPQADYGQLVWSGGSALWKGHQ